MERGVELAIIVSHNSCSNANSETPSITDDSGAFVLSDTAVHRELVLP